jgi:hypothetical protein
VKTTPHLLLGPLVTAGRDGPEGGTTRAYALAKAMAGQGGRRVWLAFHTRCGIGMGP